MRRYGARAAVGGLDLVVEEGDLYGFLGPNGAGKTTAIRCILGLIRRDAGEVQVFGERDPVAQRATVGAMVETPRFYDWMSGRENLRLATLYAGRGGEPDIDAALHAVGLTERQRDKVRGYSLGMRQRLGIARALVGKPRLLVLDEPTNGLDPRGMKEVRDLLRELCRRERLTVFLSSHLLSEVQSLCNRVGIIDRGLLTAEGEVNALLAARGLKTRVEIGVTDRRAAVEALGRVPGATLIGDGEGGRLVVELDRLDAAGLNRLLVQAGVDLHTLVPGTGSLEDVYLQATSQEAGVSG